MRPFAATSSVGSGYLVINIQAHGSKEIHGIYVCSWSRIISCIHTLAKRYFWLGAGKPCICCAMSISWLNAQSAPYPEWNNWIPAIRWLRIPMTYLETWGPKKKLTIHIFHIISLFFIWFSPNLYRTYMTVSLSHMWIIPLGVKLTPPQGSILKKLY